MKGDKKSYRISEDDAIYVAARNFNLVQLVRAEDSYPGEDYKPASWA